MARAMIVSVGGSANPIIKAIDRYQPALVCFFVSEQSVEQVAGIKQATAVGFTDIKELTPSIDDLLTCYGAAIRAAERVEAAGYGADEIVVDYTGGTKSMTAALVLATVSRGYAFSYVSGDERTKGGMGQVIDGKERLVPQLNPREVLAIDEQERLAWLFNHYQFAAATALLARLCTRVPQDTRLGRVFACLADAVAGYAAWDRFAHREAAPLLRRGLSELRKCALFLQDSGLESFCLEMEASLAFFERMSDASAKFHPDHLCHEMVIDLVANAERRALEGKYDDAVARLYRALEMAAQTALAARERPLCSKAVPLDEVPAELRDEFAQRYPGRQRGQVTLPLEADYRLLNALGDPLGSRFMAAGDRIRDLLAARNNSILAHGLAPVRPDTYEGLLASLLAMLGVNRRELPRFPTLKLELYLPPR